MTFLVGVIALAVLCVLTIIYDRFHESCNTVIAWAAAILLGAAALTAAAFFVFGIPFMVGSAVRWVFGF